MKHVILCSQCKKLSNWESNIQKYICSKCGYKDVDHQTEAKKLFEKNEIEEFFNFCSENLNVPWEKKSEVNVIYCCVDYCEEAGENFCCKTCPRLDNCKDPCCNYESEECENRKVR